MQPDMINDETRSTLLGLFTEIARVEHLMRTRLERIANQELTAAQFGVLNHFILQKKTEDREAAVAWAFQDDPAYMAKKIDSLAEAQLIDVEESAPDRLVKINDAGRAAHARSLARIQPEVAPLVEGLELDDLKTSLATLREMRRTLDNLPDR